MNWMEGPRDHVSEFRHESLKKRVIWKRAPLDQISKPPNLEQI